MSENVNVTILMNTDVKRQADILFDELGFSFSTAEICLLGSVFV